MVVLGARLDGREYLLVLGERSESLSTWDVTFPQHPRLVSHVPTGEAPEGVKANVARGFAQRNTFVIDPKGRIAKVYLGVDPNKHSEEVLAMLDEVGAKK